MPHVPLPPFAAYAGARRPKLLILGEAWGRTEDEYKAPFVGASGHLLHQILGEAGAASGTEDLHAEALRHAFGVGFVAKRNRWLEAAGIGMTNVLGLRPPDNKIDALTRSKKEIASDGSSEAKRSLGLGPIQSPGRFLDPQYLGELDRLRSEIDRCVPNVILALGATAAWAAFQATNIGSTRGTFARTSGTNFSPRKAIVSYHPAAVMRQWAWRPVLLADTMKALRGAGTPDLEFPSRELIIRPTLEDITSWTTDVMATPPEVLGCDTETKAGQITCIGFARSRSSAIVIPFWSFEDSTGSYWKTSYEEQRAWTLTRELLRSGIPLLFQNGMYDLQYILRHGIVPTNVAEDSMLMHHSLFPELQKGLGFLGSIYTNETSWKLMRKRKTDVEKPDE